MRLAARHSHTGERFRLMDEPTLRKVLRRTYKHAADSPADQRAAQAELKRRRNLPRQCDQKCGSIATVYAMDRQPGGWGGWYCEACAHGLRYMVVDRARTPTTEGTA